MRLLLTAPCQMALQDPEAGHSLIAIFHEIKINVSLDAPAFPSEALLPKEWAVFSKFGLNTDEEGKDYTLTTEIFWPDGRPLMRHVLPAAQPTKDGMAFITRMQGFPMGQNGLVRITQILSSDGKTVLGPVESEIRVTVERSLPPIQNPT